MKILSFLAQMLAAFCLFIGGVGAAAGEVVLVEDGQPRAVILLPAEAPDPIATTIRVDIRSALSAPVD